MAGSFDYLEPLIRKILRAPGTDFATVSARRVRRQMPDFDSSLSAEYLKEHKDKVDELIARVYEEVIAENAADADGVSSDEHTSSATVGHKRHRRDDDDGEEQDEQDEKPARSAPKKSKKASKNGQAITDEELARKLQNEINGRTTRTSGKSSAKARAPKARTKKSAATVETDDESGDEVSVKKSRKKKTSSGGEGKKNGFQKDLALSEALADVLQVDRLSRPQVVKQLWDYIKSNELQNPNNKKEILCDSKLKAVFGVDKIGMFIMNKALGRHLHPIEES